MKKSRLKKRGFFFWVGLALVAFFLIGWVFLIKANAADEKNNLTGWLIFKTDAPTNGNGHWAQGLTAYVQHGSWGINLDAFYDYKSEYREVAPYLVYNKGPLYLVAGFLKNSEDQSFIPVGVWYCDKFRNVDYFIDIRNYFGLNGAEGYLDSFLNVTYPLGKKWQIGADIEQIHYWEKSSNDTFLAGPVIGYKLTKSLKLCVRLAREWAKEDYTDKIRMFLQYEF